MLLIFEFNTSFVTLDWSLIAVIKTDFKSMEFELIRIIFTHIFFHNHLILFVFLFAWYFIEQTIWSR